MTEEIRKKIADAQMVLVGIGKEMDEAFQGMEQEPRYERLLGQAEESTEKEVLLQYIRLAWLRERRDERKKKAYEDLASLLAGKNYFIVTLSTDDAIFGTGLDEGRIVAPCGGFRAMQCPEAQCSVPQNPEEQHQEGDCPQAQCPDPQAPADGHGQEGQEPSGVFADPSLWERPLAQLLAGEPLSAIEFPRCPKCGRLLAFYQITTPGYLEEGYLPQWKKYQKWLQGTLNRRLCILELGAGMEYPSVIRFPFERVAFFNQKAELVRVHSRLYQMTAELKDRGVPVKADPAAFLLGE